MSTALTATSVRELPGPPGIPILGNLPWMAPSRLHHVLDRWCAEYGPLYRVSVPGRSIVVVSDPELNRDILRRRPEDFRRQSTIESIMDEMGSNGLFSLEGDAWRRRRKLAMPAFNAANLRSFHPTLEMITERLRNRWLRGSPDDMRADLTRYTVDVTAKLTFDYDINTIEQSGDVIQRHLEHIFPMLNRRLNLPIPYWHYVKLPADRALDRALRALRADTDDLLARARATVPEQPRNFIEALLLAQHDDEFFTDEELFAEALTILVAGQDTTSNALAWLLYHLAGRPEVQQRIRDELAEIPSALDRQPYLEAVVAESMRLRPTTPLLLMEAVRETAVGGVRIPAGTWVVVDVGYAAVQPANFSDPTSFDPTRWLGETAHGTHRPEISMPFGAGPRFCPGRGLAMAELKSVVAMACDTFDIRVPDGVAPPRERFDFAVVPVDLRLELVRRSA